jgi:HEAT repeat protein
MRRFICVCLSLALAGLAGGPLAAQQKKEPRYQGQPLGHWIRLLQSGSEKDRQAAAEAIVTFGPQAKEAVPVLIRLLQSGSEKDREAAAWAITTFGPEAKKEAVPVLIDILEDLCPKYRAFGATELGNLGPTADSAVPALTRLLKDDNSEVRYDATEALRAIGAAAKSAVPALIPLLQDQGWYKTRVIAAGALAEIDPKNPNIVPALGLALGDDMREVRASAAAALGRLGPGAKAALPALKKALNSQEEGQEDLIKVLVQIGPAALPTLIELLEAEKPEIRCQAAAILGNMGPAARVAVPALRKALQDQEPAVRSATAAAVQALKEKDAPGRNGSARKTASPANTVPSAEPAGASPPTRQKAAPHPAPASSRHEADETPARRLHVLLKRYDKRRRQMHDMRAKFTWTKLDRTFGDKTVGHGECWFCAPDLLRVDETEGAGKLRQIIVWTNKEIRIYDFQSRSELSLALSPGSASTDEGKACPLCRTLEKTLIEAYLAAKPLYIGMPTTELRARYDLRLTKEDKDRAYIELRPRRTQANPAFVRAEVVLSLNTHLVRRIWLEFPNGDETMWDFEKVKVNLNPPLSAETITKDLSTGWKRFPEAADGIQPESGKP